MSGRAYRAGALAAAGAVVAGLISLALGSPTASAAAPCTWAVSGSVHPNIAHVGDAITASANVTAPARCGGITVNITGEGGVLNQTLKICSVPTGGGSCSVTFSAYKGLTTVRARLSNGQSTVLGNVTVIDSTTSATKSSTPPPPTTTAARPSTSAATSPTASKTKKKASPTVTRTNPTLTRPDSPWETGVLPSEDGPAPTDDTTLQGSPIAVEVTHGSGGASPIPIGFVLASLSVLAIVFGAVVRIIVVHNRPDTPR